MDSLPADPDALLTRADFARFLKCGKTVLSRMEAEGELPDPTIWVGKAPRWRAGAIRDWLRVGSESLPESLKSSQKPVKAAESG